jgi:hypothetical protein
MSIPGGPQVVPAILLAAIGSGIMHLAAIYFNCDGFVVFACELGTALGIVCLVRYLYREKTWEGELDRKLSAYRPTNIAAYRQLQDSTRSKGYLDFGLVTEWIRTERVAVKRAAGQYKELTFLARTEPQDVCYGATKYKVAQDAPWTATPNMYGLADGVEFIVRRNGVASPRKASFAEAIDFIDACAIDIQGNEVLVTAILGYGAPFEIDGAEMSFERVDAQVRAAAMSP